MVNKLYHIYRFLFARRIFYKFNKLIYSFALRGLGILNYENDQVSGEAFFLKHYLSHKKKTIILDIGGNVGNFACKVMRIEPSAQVYSFEPHPKTYFELRAASEKNGFKSFNIGCGRENTKLNLYDYAEKDGSEHASLYEEVIENIHKSKAIGHVVNIVKLDDFCSQLHINEIDLLKIDAEGSELNVLKGLEEYIKLRKVKAIHFEFNEMNVVSRTFFKDFYGLLSEYDFYRMLPNDLMPIKKYDALFCEIFAYQNIVAILRSPP